MPIKKPLKYLSNRSVSDILPFYTNSYITSLDHKVWLILIKNASFIYIWAIQPGYSPVLHSFPPFCSGIFVAIPFLKNNLHIFNSFPKQENKQASKQWVRDSQPRADVWINRLIDTYIRIAAAWYTEVYWLWQKSLTVACSKTCNATLGCATSARPLVFKGLAVVYTRS